ncbi:MAG: tRNA U34 5-methylaminomethyl-2-thiouridine-forming methyltransferase MnmC [Marivirga sp.]|jgi:tRNA U34 5-methylaminomethyl-2-thiouridine-forming methyltransferase MnmC
MAEIKIITTEDGSHSLYHEGLKETYHSFHGALRESLHVFIDKGLRFWRTKEGLPDAVKIFEVGFGTGLNALLAAQFAMEHGIKVYYHTIEPFPLSEEIIAQLNYSKQINNGAYDELYKEIHASPWETENALNAYFTIFKEKTTLQEIDLQTGTSFNLIFFDAFAPSKQAEMWGIELIEKCFNSLQNKGVFVTYSAKGQLKRDLKSVGFELETVAGPPGKKEMVRGIKN